MTEFQADYKSSKTLVISLRIRADHFEKKSTWNNSYLAPQAFRPEDRRHPFFERRVKVLTLSPVDGTLSKG